MGRFSEKVAIVTGAASGVGRATAAQMVDEGASVLGIDVDGDGLDAVAAELGDNFAAEVHDISSRDECHTAVEAAVQRFGRLDVLANVAGIAQSHHLTDVDEATWQRIMGVNVDGMFWMTQAAIPHLLATGGNIVNVASNAGVMGQAYTVPYCASKGAVVNMTRAIAMEFIKTDLRCNAIAPGGMVTALSQNFELAEGVDFELMARYSGLRGMAKPETAAQAICWIASEEASRCNGAILAVDGGLTAG